MSRALALLALLAVGCSEPTKCPTFYESTEDAYAAGLQRGWDLAPTEDRVEWLRWPSMISLHEEKPDRRKLICIDYQVGDMTGSGAIEIAAERAAYERGQNDLRKRGLARAEYERGFAEAREAAAKFIAGMRDHFSLSSDCDYAYSMLHALRPTGSEEKEG